MLPPVLRILHGHIEVHVFRRRGRRLEFLCLRRAATRAVLPGVWQPVTGKRRRFERGPTAALRELFEETGLHPRRFWALETVSLYFDPTKDAVRLLPLFVAEVGAKDRVRLSREHDAFRFLSPRAAGRRYLWEAQRRALDSVRREVLGSKALAAALEVRLARRARRGLPRSG
jgi:8-oxo-dGTP pyrophosphatase MutT (NUDIX family)